MTEKRGVKGEERVREGRSGRKKKVPWERSSKENRDWCMRHEGRDISAIEGCGRWGVEVAVPTALLTERMNSRP